MPAQDDAREQQMLWMFNLRVPDGRTRGGLDAVLELDNHPSPIPFELKSTTGDSVSTVRDFSPEHISKWEHLHWLFAFYKKDATTLRYCYYASPADMSDWIKDKEKYIQPDFVLAQQAPQRITDGDLDIIFGNGTSFSKKDAQRIMKNQWSKEKYSKHADLPGGRYSRDAMLALLRERCEYVIRRGATLNNPHIPERYLESRVDRIFDDHAATVRRLVRRYIDLRADKIAIDQNLPTTP
ncbi:hypothetical protein [Nocardia panacis]|uniref:hypothetical protein n=1 Tax=Nocardia panacis TaxID=2340916 RepID=UPI0011C40B8F|nr:hypothetical protein [Nocardia panacis]